MAMGRKLWGGSRKKVSDGRWQKEREKIVIDGGGKK